MDPRCKNWRRRAAFLKSARRSQKGARPPLRFLSSSLTKDDAAVVCAHAAVVEKREKRGKSMKSIRSHERSKQGRRRGQREGNEKKTEWRLEGERARRLCAWSGSCVRQTDTTL